MLLRSILCGGVLNVSLLGRAKGEEKSAVSVVARMVMDIYFGTTFHHILHVRELHEFMILVTGDRTKWARCQLWHGWLPGLGVCW